MSLRSVHEHAASSDTKIAYSKLRKTKKTGLWACMKQWSKSICKCFTCCCGPDVVLVQPSLYAPRNSYTIASESVQWINRVADKYNKMSVLDSDDDTACVSGDDQPFHYEHLAFFFCFYDEAGNKRRRIDTKNARRLLPVLFDKYAEPPIDDPVYTMSGIRATMARSSLQTAFINHGQDERTTKYRYRFMYPSGDALYSPTAHHPFKSDLPDAGQSYLFWIVSVYDEEEKTTTEEVFAINRFQLMQPENRKSIFYKMYTDYTVSFAMNPELFSKWRARVIECFPGIDERFALYAQDTPTIEEIERAVGEDAFAAMYMLEKDADRIRGSRLNPFRIEEPFTKRIGLPLLHTCVFQINWGISVYQHTEKLLSMKYPWQLCFDILCRNRIASAITAEIRGNNWYTTALNQMKRGVLEMSESRSTRISAPPFFTTHIITIQDSAYYL